tara:strand:+ start:99 stop:950 length:852 start_codon:yes stop_codon:yes gene_type:complete
MKNQLILDGAMGTELERRGISLTLPIWSADANLTHPSVVKDIHQNYISEGVDIITTNTFRTTTWTYRLAGYTPMAAKERAKNSLYNAVESAHNASQGSVLIAGSITSIDDCYLPENFPGKGLAQDVYGEIIEWFRNTDVDILLFETMGNIQEIEIALQMLKETDKKVWLSIIMKDGDHLLDGTSFEDLFRILNKFKIDCLLNNCNQVGTTVASLKNIRSGWTGMWGVYPNLGLIDYENDYSQTLDDSNFRFGMTSILAMEPNVVGICCGSTPNHIKLLKSIIN